MARPKGPEQRVPVKMRVNIGLMDRLQQLATENRYSVPKMLTVIMEETLADLPADYELHEMAEIYTLTKNHAVNLTLLSRAFIPPRKYEGKIPAAAKMSGLHFLRSVFILSQFDFVFQKVPKPCTFKGSGDHRNTKEDWELIFEIFCAYYRVLNK